MRSGPGAAPAPPGVDHAGRPIGLGIGQTGDDLFAVSLGITARAQPTRTHRLDPDLRTFNSEGVRVLLR
jgi:hypothetical protein